MLNEERREKWLNGFVRQSIILDGNLVKFYWLPRDPSIQREYEQIIKTTGLNWKKGHICAEHWSSGEQNMQSWSSEVVIYFFPQFTIGLEAGS